MSMRKIVMILVLVGNCMSQNSPAAEIDSVTPRGLELENSLPLLDEIFNNRLQEGVQKANAKLGDIEDLETDEFCDEEVLYTELRKAIFQSLTASWGLKGYGLDKQLRILLADQSHSLLLNDSIYRDISYLEGFSLNLKELSDVVNIDGHFVGLDKLGHFFAEGWHYFELSDFKEANLDQALEWGKEQESGKFGYTTTGIFSYADLVANFNGWRFWNKVLSKEDDPLKGFFANLFNQSYVTCDIQFLLSIKHRKIVKAWEYNTRFDLNDYVDGAWDEGNNCNSYEDADIEEKVTFRVKEVNPDFICPAYPANCLEAQKKYGEYAKHLLHPSCLHGNELEM